MNAIGNSVIATVDPGGLLPFSPPSHLVLAQSAVSGAVNNATGFVQNAGSQFGRFIPNLLGALVILIVGWIAATIVASALRGILKRTALERRLAGWTGQSASTLPPIGNWIATAVYWIILAFVLVAFFNALQLQVVSAPLNTFLQQIFNYLPRLGSAALLLLGAWLIATLAKFVVTRGLARFDLDNRLADTAGGADSPFVLSETLGNALYWFVFLFFLPLVLDVLQLQGPLEPVQNLLNQFLLALPRIVTAVLIGAIGWFIAKVVRGVVTNLLAAVGTDRIGARVGISQSTGNLSLSSLLGTIVYVLVLIPTVIAALNALNIQAISAPAVSMLQQVMAALPRIFTAGLIVALFYVIGRFVADLIANILTGIGFNNITNVLGFPELTEPTQDAPRVGNGHSTAALPRKTPSEVVGIIALVGIVLFGAVAATEVLGLPILTALVNSVLAIAGRVLVGVVVFAVGLYLATLAYRLITASGGRQAEILGQVARIAIIALVSAMALQQMGIASNIVNLAFGLLLGAIAVAIALAFGLGGRDAAGDQVRNWLDSFKASKSESRSEEYTGTRR